MRLTLKTWVSGEYRDVFSKFDRHLFEFLLPGAGDVDLIEFGGSEVGNIVHLRFGSPLRGEWISEITERQIDEEEACFVDVGKVLPFGLRNWRHRHIVRRIDDDHSLIVDDIEYGFSNSILTAILFPVVYLAFYPRKHQYRKYFNR